MTVEQLATFLYVMMANLENDIYSQLTSQGIQLDLVRLAPQLQIQEYVEMLTKEEYDGDT